MTDTKLIRNTPEETEAKLMTTIVKQQARIAELEAELKAIKERASVESIRKHLDYGFPERKSKLLAGIISKMIKGE